MQIQTKVQDFKVTLTYINQTIFTLKKYCTYDENYVHLESPLYNILINQENEQN